MAVLASGCTLTPSSGPSSRAIESGAADRIVLRGDQRVRNYALIDITSDLIPVFEGSVVSSLASGFGTRFNRKPFLPLGIGDVVQVSVFESQAGGLFVPADAGSRPGNYVTFPQQTINRDGAITVPYAGRIRAAGLSVEDVQSAIERALASRAIEPQVLITKIASRSAQVAVLGDVNSPTKVEISDAGERILDVISQAGGLSAPGIETYITVQRGSRSATVSYQRLASDPRENIFLVPGDTVLVNRERRTYSVFGASGLNGRFDFEESGLNLSEALSKAGGLLDSRADPSQVVLYRVISLEMARKLSIDTSRFTNEVPVIFRADLRKPELMFALKRFPMQDKDIIYITNAESVEINKVFDFVNSVSSTASGVTGDIRSTRNNLKALKD